jgi:transposase-like protein
MANQKRKRYSREFKLQAAKMVVELGYSCAEKARQLGITSWSIRNWIEEFRKDGTLPPKDQPDENAIELAAMKKENAQLRLENEILKKAAAFFAKERKYTAFISVDTVHINTHQATVS